MRFQSAFAFFAAVALTTVSLTTGACSSPAGPSDSKTVTVLAASSLTDSFTKIGAAFEAEHRTTRVVFSFAASSALVTQVMEGAPADIVATADQATMAKLLASKDVCSAVPFAQNKLTILVAKGNPKRITSVEDLRRPELLVVLGAPEAPIGTYAQQVLAKANVTVKPKSFEENARAIVSRVASGEADAGIVYATDAAAMASKADAVAIPDSLNVIATYPLAVTAQGSHRSTGAEAEAFVRFVTGAGGQEILLAFGFSAAP